MIDPTSLSLIDSWLPPAIRGLTPDGAPVSLVSMYTSMGLVLHFTAHHVNSHREWRDKDD